MHTPDREAWYLRQVLVSVRRGSAPSAGMAIDLRDEAIRHLEVTVVLAPRTGEYLCAWAEAYELAARNEESLAVIQWAITLNPAVDKYYRVLASVASKTGAYRLYNQGLLGMVGSSGCCSHVHKS